MRPDGEWGNGRRSADSESWPEAADMVGLADTAVRSAFLASLDLHAALQRLDEGDPAAGPLRDAVGKVDDTIRSVRRIAALVDAERSSGSSERDPSGPSSGVDASPAGDRAQ